MIRACCNWPRAGVLVLMLLVAAGGAVAKDLDDRSIRIIMEMAWDQHPTRYTGPDRKTIITDKSKKAQIVVPIAMVIDEAPTTAPTDRSNSPDTMSRPTGTAGCCGM